MGTLNYYERLYKVQMMELKEQVLEEFMRLWLELRPEDNEGASRLFAFTTDSGYGFCFGYDGVKISFSGSFIAWVQKLNAAETKVAELKEKGVDAKVEFVEYQVPKVTIKYTV
jgi:hypothetical protein